MIHRLESTPASDFGCFRQPRFGVFRSGFQKRFVDRYRNIGHVHLTFYELYVYTDYASTSPAGRFCSIASHFGIATALPDADVLLVNLEALIAKKHNIYKFLFVCIR
jgi:hypothetical protein